jgi:hypothetical protein
MMFPVTVVVTSIKQGGANLVASRQMAEGGSFATVTARQRRHFVPGTRNFPATYCRQFAHYRLYSFTWNGLRFKPR